MTIPEFFLSRRFVFGAKKMKVELISFGHKYGVPEADIVLDMRCLENPFWVPELRRLSGLEEPVQEYILRFPACKAYIEKLLELICLQASMEEKRGGSRLRIAIGCTGGRHRSVTIANALYQQMQSLPYSVRLEHRDMRRNIMQKNLTDEAQSEKEKG